MKIHFYTSCIYLAVFNILSLPLPFYLLIMFVDLDLLGLIFLELFGFSGSVSLFPGLGDFSAIFSENKISITFCLLILEP